MALKWLRLSANISVVLLILILHVSDNAAFKDDIIEALIESMDGARIAQNVRLFTNEPHPAGTDGNARVANKIADKWRENGLEDVHFVKYNVLLNYPDYRDPNHVVIFHADTKRTVFESSGVSPAILPDEQGAEGAGLQWLAYSPNGIVEADVVYCHYGSSDDFEFLESMHVSVAGRIALMRYNEQFRAAKIMRAQARGAVGALLYSDPAECAADGIDAVYPNTVWMPREGVQRGTIKQADGDALTPLYPSRFDLFRGRTIDEARAVGDLPSIPALPLSYGDAFEILSRLNGSLVPDNWRGGLNLTYRIGPGFRDRLKFRMKVNSYFEQREIRNVVGYIHGREEPDEYVMLGNHFDAWVYGAIDPNSGTGTLAEVARALATATRRAGWRPRRTLMFCAWDAEEYGLIGSTEFVQDFANLLTDRTVIYLNVDLIVSNRTFNADTTPELFDVVVETARQIPNPMQAELRLGRKTIYDTWIVNKPAESDSRRWWPRGYPRMRMPGGGSDHSSFLTYLGVPVVDFRYENASNVYPLYHTLYETPFVNERLYDVDNFAVHRAVGQYWAVLAYRFADADLLPLNVSSLARAIRVDYVVQLKRAVEKIRDRVSTLAIRDAQQQISFLIRKSQEFTAKANAFMATLADVDTMVAKQSFMTRFFYRKLDAVLNSKIAALNRRIKAMNRCFVNPRGAPGLPASRHVLYSLNSEDTYVGTVMPAVYQQLERLVDADTVEKQMEAGRALAREISIVQYSIQCAINTIANFI